MSSDKNHCISIKNATANNLKGISLDIPHHKFIVVTGVSGSGKSSLAFDIIAKEGQRRYFETLPSFARQFAGKISPVAADSITGLSPVITVSQKTTGMNVRSTVGTLSDLYSFFRLLYARVGKFESGNTSNNILQEETPKLTRSLFSFNSKQGKCLRCNGLGQEEEIDLKKLITHPNKSIREGALAPTLPTGYIMYSQVTIDVLNEVCKAEGFTVDIPWNELTEKDKNSILFGSDKINVPFGKHSIESRLKWTGIKAKPREEGFYKGMIPIMSDILRRDRNPNILKYVSSVTCQDCKGKKLNQFALSISVFNKTIIELMELPLYGLEKWINNQNWNEISIPIISKIKDKLALLSQIGLGYLYLNHPSIKLSGSEIQRIRIINQIGTNLSNVLYVFDEPSIGLDTEENKTLIHLLKNLVKKGNTVIVVEHDLETIKKADWIIDIGPKAGLNGGTILFNGTITNFLNNKYESPTLDALSNAKAKNLSKKETNTDKNAIRLTACNEGYLQNVNAHFPLGKLTIVTGKSGSGKANLVKDTLKQLVLNKLQNQTNYVHLKSAENIDRIDRLVYADQSPIGRTPRSNPATYIGLSDEIRSIFAKLPKAKEIKLTKSHFSFNTKGGRCETCQGAGKTQIGMHFLGKIDLICNECNGKRFNKKTLSVLYKDKTISEIYDLTIDAAFVFFKDQKKLSHSLNILCKIGLGYLSLGQSSTTLSGGEAQRIKLANELQKKSSGNTLYIIDEPSIGLHTYDIKKMIRLFNELKANGNTVVCIEQDETLLQEADYIIRLPHNTQTFLLPEIKHIPKNTISLTGVNTHLLKNISARFPKNKLTVVTGLSGSGKSSLVYNSLFAEAQSRFSESLSTFNRSFIQNENQAKIENADGLTPTIALKTKKGNTSIRSTVGTTSGINDYLRLLFSRIAQQNGKKYTAQHFSFNHKLGACPQCKGKGFEKKADPELLIIDPTKSIFDGALTTNKTANYYLNLDSQFIAILKAIAKQYNWILTVPWNKLSKETQTIILYGTGDKKWKTLWEFKTKTRQGQQNLDERWMGFCGYINDEFERRQFNKNIQPLVDLLMNSPCELCNGKRLNNAILSVQFSNLSIAETTALNVYNCYSLFSTIEQEINNETKAILHLIKPKIQSLLKTIIDLGLGYLTLDRPINTLSGGELQRINLAGQLSSELFGVTYVLDEPTIGLDAKQIKILLHILHQIKEKGNTIIAIEHNKDFISSAEYILEMSNGKIQFQGNITDLKNHPNTVTYQLINKPLQLKPKQFVLKSHSFGIKKAFENNLKSIDVTFKSNQITAITGVSGSGKSTLLKSVLFASHQKKRPQGCEKIFGFSIFDTVLLMDQNPISSTSLSSIASFIGILNHLQTHYSKTENAKNSNLKKADFSYQSKKGKCPNCNGYGKTKTVMDFMNDLWIKCDVCEGLRYSQSILDCTNSINNKRYSIGDLFQLTIQELFNLLDEKKLNTILQLLIEIGLGHLQVGQSCKALSGGETQRLKLAKSILEQKGTTLYLFDEPSTGLHQIDLLKIITVFNQLIEKGQTILFIDHNETLISIAQEQIRLGPSSGENGGTIVN